MIGPSLSRDIAGGVIDALPMLEKFIDLSTGGDGPAHSLFFPNVVSHVL